MSQIMTRSLLSPVVILIMIVAAGCSNPNAQSNFTDNGKHTAGWLPAGHASSASADLTACAACHGTSLDGGIADVSCTSCHLGGPTSVHPSGWVPMYLTHGPAVSTGATTTALCANQYCHGTNLSGVTNSGPSCTSCHSLPYDPTTVICGACHRIPPSGTTSPNRAGKHAQHATSAPSSCDICHNGASAYAGDHSNGIVNLSFQAAYNAQSGGTATFQTATNFCSNISCHGGKITPNWLTGAIDVNTQCTACHDYNVSQYNSFRSGEHDKHVNGEKIACISCHDTGLLAVSHFTTLNTSAMEGPARNTIKTSIGYDGTSCAHPCHGSENW